MKTLFILPNRRVPFTAKQYVDECQAKENRAACARIDFAEASFRLLCYSALTLGACAVAGGFIQIAILLAK